MSERPSLPDWAIVYADDHRIRRRCAPVLFSEETDLPQTFDRMFRAMYAEEGVGLAAIQIGIDKQLLVLDTESFMPPSRQVVMINPKIIWQSDDEVLMEEGCLSIPGVRVEVSRSRAIAVSFLNADGAEETIEVGDWYARVIQHEMDHLNGVLMIDGFSTLRRNLWIQKMKKHRRREKDEKTRS